ncbi:MAG: hypothetical protein P4L40_23805 [Terracidiphilus sp.]|nr:hypothetical protein [Terracidiphilus sp.]
MFSLFKGDCEHCGRDYRYSLVDASFSDCSYAYCDTCGKLATVSYANSFLLRMPPISTPHQVIDAAWEPFLRPCACGGHFRRGAAPRCMTCLAELSPEHAAGHIERNFLPAARGWHWQRNWTGAYCLDIEDPATPGIVRQIENPFFHSKTRSEIEPAAKPGFFSRLFKSNQ